MIRPEYHQQRFPHWLTLPVRFRDLDPLNHVNNALFCTYFEEARIAFIQDMPSLAGQLEQGFSFVLANIKIDFIKPIEYPAQVLVGSGIKKLGHSSISSFQAIYRSGTQELLSVAETHGVWFNLSKQRPSRIPELPDKDRLMLPEDLFE